MATTVRFRRSITKNPGVKLGDWPELRLGIRSHSSGVAGWLAGRQEKLSHEDVEESINRRRRGLGALHHRGRHGLPEPKECRYGPDRKSSETESGLDRQRLW